MIIVTLPARKRHNPKRTWHRKFVFLRRVQIGGQGTTEPARNVIALCAWIWARRSQSLGRWIFAEACPASPSETASTPETKGVEQ